jgi:hypothetical protein
LKKSVEQEATKKAEGSWVNPLGLCPEQNGDFGRVTFFVSQTIVVNKQLAWV